MGLHSFRFFTAGVFYTPEPLITVRKESFVRNVAARVNPKLDHVRLDVCAGLVASAKVEIVLLTNPNGVDRIRLRPLHIGHSASETS